MNRGTGTVAQRVDSSFRLRIALHEAGHALLAFHLLGTDRVAHLTLAQGSSGGLGAASLRVAESPELITRVQVIQQLAVLLGGRAAECLVYGEDDVSSGPSNDLAEATKLAEQAIGSCGLDPSFKLLSVMGLTPGLRFGLSAALLERIGAWIREAEAEALSLLRLHRNALERLTNHLLEKETLFNPEVVFLLQEDATGCGSDSTGSI